MKDYSEKSNSQKYSQQGLLVDQVTEKSAGVGRNLWTSFNLFVVFILFGVSVILGMFLSKAVAQMPNVADLNTFRPNESTLIYDRYNQLIANIHGDEDRVVVPLTEISENLQRAVLATEDNRFYEHFGIDPKGTARAILTNLKNPGGRVQGGSSITQQLVKNLFLSPEQSFKRKLAEAILAVKVEAHYPKDKILEMYLNQVYYGNHSYGAEKAARRYFKIPASQLSLAQAALLAGLLQSPEGLSPYANPKGARSRQIEVLDNMVEYGYITPRQRQLALKEPIKLASRAVKPSKYPYFVAHVIQELEAKYGKDVVKRGGLKVYTTLDPKSQDRAQEVVERFINSARGTRVQQGALVSIDVKTGEILSLVGGTDYEHNQFNTATQARRAVGSTFKPFVYLTALRLERILPTTPICDRPISYGNWSPKNWDGHYFGCMNIRKALVLSRNTPTVQIGMKVGVEEVLETAHLAGIKSNIDPNPSSFLGSSGVSPLELVNGYATLARGGIYMPAKSIRKVVDNRGNVAPMDEEPSRRVFKQDYVAALVDILVDVVEQGTGKNARLNDRMVAGKTGTTDEVKDIWFMGFTSDLATGVWFGNSRNIPLSGVFSSNSAKVWHDYMTHFYETHPRKAEPFFIASNTYAARAHLTHLIDAKGVQLVRRNLKGLDDELTFNDVGSGKPTLGRIEGFDEGKPTQFAVKIDGQTVNVEKQPSATGRIEPVETPSVRPIQPVEQPQGPVPNVGNEQG